MLYIKYNRNPRPTVHILCDGNSCLTLHILYKEKLSLNVHMCLKEQMQFISASIEERSPRRVAIHSNPILCTYGATGKVKIG